MQCIGKSGLQEFILKNKNNGYCLETSMQHFVIANVLLLLLGLLWELFFLKMLFDFWKGILVVALMLLLLDHPFTF